jgi:LPXTG-site transpeptidase (sortase) family protein
VWDFLRVRPKKRSVKKPRGSGVLFNNPGVASQWVFSLANVVIAVSFVYLGYLYQPLVGSIVRVRLFYKQPPAKVTIVPRPTTSIKPVTGNLKIWNYEIEIPKIGASAKLTTKVSPFNSSEYLKVLDQGFVAHAQGTPLPGEETGQASFIFAHSTNQGLSRVRNNAVFYMLGDLVIGDQMIIRRGDESLVYEVIEKKIVSANDISYLNYRDDAKTSLIVQTCWPLGTDWRRLLIMAKRI